jgi:hypothetical protein
MFNNVAIDVVIGLIFVYLLYSLLATVISEIIATWMGLRARNLKEAVNRMLTSEEVDGLANRLMDSLKLMKDPKNPIINNFYAHPEIKQLGSSGIFKNPSSFKAESFSKTLLYLLNETGALDKERIDTALRKADLSTILSPEAARYILFLWEDSYGDVLMFKTHLEAWFNRSMEQATEWYKRKIQVVLLLLGFCLAWFFNADTFTIIDKLSNDKNARAELVTLATAYASTQTAPAENGATAADFSTARLDSLEAVKMQLKEDISKANTILGLGSWPADSAFVSLDPQTKKKIYTPLLDPLALTHDQRNATEGEFISFSPCQKWVYFFNLLKPHFFGFFLTGIAISLGAPFWFDLLNKLIKFRTSTKQDTDNTGSTTSAQPTN